MTRLRSEYCDNCKRYVVVVPRYRVNHALHLALAILTCGVWIVIWALQVIDCAIRGSACPHCGEWL